MSLKYFKLTQGWSEAEIIAQVLTPIEDSALLNPTTPDPNSIMCYQIPGTITKRGKPILGGVDIDALDYEYAAKIYPKAVAKPGELP
ncbi:MAG TPA: peptidase M12, partial [Verrucomicrobiae bacterium]|nr:peptidase M12 [Verrucomicrobiae bacterium]